MAKKVLSVGQCMPDNAAIRRFLEKHFAVEYATAEAADDALAALRNGGVDLVLINRKLDLDYSDGLEVLKRIKADAAVSSVPVMLVSNYPEAHAEAVALGALHGFGKLELSKPEAVERVQAVLG